MTTYTIYGASDDLVEVEKDGESLKEYDALNKTLWFEFAHPDNKLIGVIATIEFGSHGWTISTWLIDGDAPPHNWRIRIEQEEYSPSFRIEVPDNCIIDFPDVGEDGHVIE